MITIIGPHKVNCGSLVSGDVDRMLAGETVAIFYSDPPWGDGNLAYWKTMNKKITGQDVPQINHEQLYDRITQLIQRYVRGHVFIETGVRWEKYVSERLAQAGLQNIWPYRLTYGSGGKLLENRLIVATHGMAGLGPQFDFEPSSFRGAELVRRVVSSVATPGALAFDPCCGMGYTAKAAVAAGMRFYGNELNRARLDKTMDFLWKHEAVKAHAKNT
jgi:hypothetical protein